MKKLKLNQAEFEKEVKRLLKAQRQAEKEGITFLQSPIPKEPKRITKQHIEKLKKIKPADIKEMGVTIDSETGEQTPYRRKRKNNGDYVTKGRTHPSSVSETQGTLQRKEKHLDISHENREKLPPKEKVVRSEEERKKIRSEAAKKAWEARKAKGWKMSDEQRKKRSEATKKAWEARKAAGTSAAKVKEAVKKTDEELKKMRSEASKKAWETRKAKGWKPKEQKQIEKKSEEEIKKNRSEAVKKAWETRRKKEAENPEYKAKMDEIRRENLSKRHEKKSLRDKINDILGAPVEERPKENPDVDEIPTWDEYFEDLPEDEETPFETAEMPSYFDLCYANVMKILSDGRNKQSCDYVRGLIDQAIEDKGKSWFENRLRANESAVSYTREDGEIVDIDLSSDFDLVENAKIVAYWSDEDLIVDGGCFLISFFGGSITSDIITTLTSYALMDNPRVEGGTYMYVTEDM